MHVEPIGYNNGTEVEIKKPKKEQVPVEVPKTVTKDIKDDIDIKREAKEKEKTIKEKTQKKASNTMHAQYGIHKDTQSITVKIIDDDTNEVIRELPPEKNLDRLALTMSRLKKIDKRV